MHGEIKEIIFVCCIVISFIVVCSAHENSSENNPQISQMAPPNLRNLRFFIRTWFG